MTTSAREGEPVDILVAGGGPAGLALARQASLRGASVLVAERQPEIGKPVHTSGATTVQTMVEFGIPSDLYHVTPRLRIIGPRESATFELSQAMACVLDVTGVYQNLADQARQAGARILTGVTARAWTEGGRVRGGHLTGTAASWHQPATILADATGYRAALSKESGLHPGFRRFGVGAEYELLAPGYDQEELVVIVGGRFAPKGYAWAFPWGGERVRVGVGVLHADTRANPSDHLDLLMEEYDSLGIDLGGARRVEEHRGLIPAEGLPSTFVGDRVVAVGDAAGQPTLVAGEGIRLSLTAGRKAGDVVAEAVARGAVDREALLPYERWFRRKYGFALEVGQYVNRRMAGWKDPDWDEKIAAVRGAGGDHIWEQLLSDFNVLSGLRWIGRHPRYWGPALRYGARALGHLVRH